MEKWIRSAIPALLIHCSIGTVYCWSTFKASIATAIGMSRRFCRQTGRNQYSQVFTGFCYLLYGRYDWNWFDYQILYWSFGSGAVIPVLWLYYGYRTGNWLFNASKDPYAVV